jgi:hypothetical protein
MLWESNREGATPTDSVNDLENVPEEKYLFVELFRNDFGVTLSNIWGPQTITPSLPVSNTTVSRLKFKVEPGRFDW